MVPQGKYLLVTKGQKFTDLLLVQMVRSPEALNIEVKMILDLLGDLSILGHPLQGEIRAVRSGHNHNVRFVHALEKEHAAPAGVAAYLTAGLAVAQLIGAPTGAAAAIRWGRMPVITGSMVAMSVVAALAAVVPGRVLVFVMVALVGFFSFAYFSPRFAMIPEVVARPEQVGPASGLINLLGYGISMLAPWLFGLALDRGMGYLTGYLILAAFGMAGAVGSLFFKAGAPSGGGRER
mgnify:CR=1 FL=1